MDNIRDVKRVESDPKDACRGCGQRQFVAGIERTTGSIKARCLNELCDKRQTNVYLTRARNIKLWPGEPQPTGTSRTADRDKRFIVPFERSEYIYARDGEVCQHCASPLFENSDTIAELPHPKLGIAMDAGQLSLLSVPQSNDSRTPDPTARTSRPQRRKKPRALDHICPRWATRRLLPNLNEREVELLGHIAVVASCPACNTERQIPSDQLLNGAAADVYITAMQRLFANRILIDADIDPVDDTMLFSSVLKDVRNLLTGRPIERRAV